MNRAARKEREGIVEIEDEEASHEKVKVLLVDYNSTELKKEKKQPLQLLLSQHKHHLNSKHNRKYLSLTALLRNLVPNHNMDRLKDKEEERRRQPHHHQ